MSKGKQKAGKREELLVIKPYHVTAESTEAVLHNLRGMYPEVHIVLFANLLDADYERLQRNSISDENILFTPTRKRLSFMRLLGCLLQFNVRHFKRVFLLIGSPVYQGYRKGKLLAYFIATNSLNLYFVETGIIAPLYSPGIVKKIRLALSWLKYSLFGG